MEGLPISLRSVFFSGFGSTKPVIAVFCDTNLLFTQYCDIMIQTKRDLLRKFYIQQTILQRRASTPN